MARITIYAGHYGSGKTNIAINAAMELARVGEAVAIADLDIVNPYFRTKDSAEELRAAGVELISSDFAGSNVDLPSLPGGMYSIVDRRDRQVIVDVGGDDRGALALGRIAGAIREEGDCDMLFVVNFCRPLTRNAGEALEAMREIAAAAGLDFTGIINNTNLGEETTPELVLGSAAEAQRLAGLAGIPLAATTVKQEIFDHLGGAEGLVPLRLQEKIL